jgi:leucyl aminopeptidase (aminopeptidase T)
MEELVSKAADKVLADCLNLRRHEIVLILCDSTGFEIGNIFYEILINRCKEVILTVIPVRKEDCDELPSAVMQLLTRFDVAVIITEKLLSVSSIKGALSQSGVRTAVLSGVTNDVLSRTAHVDWRKVGVYTRRIAAQLSASKKIRIISEKGTDFTIDKMDVLASVDDGRLSSPGAFGPIPAGEVSISLAECKCNGVLAIDGSLLPFKGKLQEPLILEVLDGTIKKIHNHPEAASLEKKLSLYKQARILSEFGIGTLESAVVTGNIAEDRKANGTLHVTLGNCLTTKQNFYAVGTIVNANVQLDDRILINSGRVI